MKIGVSTACFYPLETEKSLEKIGKSGIKTAEIFFNAPCELEEKFIDNLCEIKDEYSIDIKSIHPFLSFGETYLFFSEYKRRYIDTLKTYEAHMKAAQKLGAKILVVHGSLSPGVITAAEYFERFKFLIETGKKYGIIVAQENVVNFLSQSPDFLRSMREYLGNDFKLVLDLKQAVRAKYSAFEFVEEFSDNIVHIHVSDSSTLFDCIPPGEGSFDFASLIKKMNLNKRDIDLIVELYKKSYINENQIIKSVEFLNNLSKEIISKNRPKD